MTRQRADRPDPTARVSVAVGERPPGGDQVDQRPSDDLAPESIAWPGDPQPAQQALVQVLAWQVQIVDPGERAGPFVPATPATCATSTMRGPLRPSAATAALRALTGPPD